MYKAITKNFKIALISTTAMAGFSNISIAADNDVKEMEEIVVTAQKRSERLIDVPISMSVLSSDALEQTGLRALKNIAEYIPNLEISPSNDFRTIINIRGVGSSSRNIGYDSRVGVYVDGVYMGQSPAVNQELLDLERVEVLRGPQGTLFGKNTVAGAISLITKKPSDEFEGKVSADVGNRSYREVKGVVNIPLADNASAKFAVSKAVRDGYVDNIITGNKLGALDTLSYRAQFRVNPTDQLEINASFDGLHSDSLILVGTPISDMLGNFPNTIATGAREVAFSADPYDKRDVSGSIFDVEYETESGLTIKSITGFRNTDASYTNQTDYAPVDVISLDYTDKFSQFSQEVQLISSDEGAFTYMLGLYYYNQDADTRRDVIIGQDFYTAFFGPLYQSGALTPPLPPFPALPVTYAAALVGFGVPGDMVFNNGKVKTKSKAIYFNGAYDISEKATFGFGGRYSIEDKDGLWLLDGTRSGIFFIGSTNGLNDPTGPSPQAFKRQDQHFAPAASLTYALDETSNIYAKYSSGYKSGGFNLDYINAVELAANPTLQFDKETVNSYEFGVKGNYLENTLTFNLAAFYSRYNDYQVQQFVDLGGGRTSIRIDNAAVVATKGIEAEFTAVANANLLFQGSIGLLKAKFDSFKQGGTGGADVSGNKLNAPDMNFAIGAQYYKPIEATNTAFLFRVDLTHRGGYFTTPDNISTYALTYGAMVPYGYIKPLTKLNARIGLMSEKDSWEVFLWGRNINNAEQTVDDLRDFFNTVSVYPNMGRSFGLEAVFNF
ncbi:MAG: TonB-dependent receptor [Sphingomonadales bacterium]